MTLPLYFPINPIRLSGSTPGRAQSLGLTPAGRATVLSTLTNFSGWPHLIQIP